MNATFLDDLKSIARALAVSPGLLLALVVGSLAVIAAVSETHSRALVVPACLVGAAIAAVGARAAARPSRPFKLESRAGRGSYVNTTRRLGLFYVLAGVVYIIVTLAGSTS